MHKLMMILIFMLTLSTNFAYAASETSLPAAAAAPPSAAPHSSNSKSAPSAPTVPSPALTSSNLTIQYDDQALIVERDQLQFPLWGLPDMEAVERLTARFRKQVNIAPLNAKWKGGDHFISGQNGRRLDDHAFTEQVLGFLMQSDSATIEAPTHLIHPKVTTELLTEITHKPIGYYVTFFNSGNKSRSHNIRLAAEAINSAVVFPGETFSFNGFLGPRTLQKGYKSAPIIVKGEMAEGVGGGICQVSSTLFNAVDRAGLKVVSRYSHSRSVSYVLPGRDATVSWGGPDFAFRNEYHQPVLIRAMVSGGSLHIMLYSSESIVTKPKNVPPASHQLPEEVPNSQVIHPKTEE
ncbi:VanW family protein [Gorillibacterium massiliense]|uniref:VanW family protein n=1 Tax=Gorillibacterium massiliense TaxID=1280390 RepID=UPI0004B9D63D|nr:VanW family protein [Gorillibacterium massiliense]